MIVKITHGRRVGDLAAYLHGPKNEHAYAGRPGGGVVAGNVGMDGDLDGTRWAQELRQAAGTRPDIERPIWHASLRLAPEDRTLTDAQWADVASAFIEEMGIGAQPWVAVRHADDHVHLVVSRVDDAGVVWSRRDDRYKARRAAVALERQWWLRRTPVQSQPETQRVADHQVSQGEHQRSTATGTPPARVSLAHQVRAAREAALTAGRGRVGFEEALTALGVGWRANVASTGRMSGYSFAWHQDKDGEPVWFKASALDKSLAWSRLGPALDAAGDPRPAPDVPRGRFESAGAWEKRRAVAQAEQVAALRTQWDADLGQLWVETLKNASPINRWWGARKTQVQTARAESQARAQREKLTAEAQQRADEATKQYGAQSDQARAARYALMRAQGVPESAIQARKMADLSAYNPTAPRRPQQPNPYRDPFAPPGPRHQYPGQDNDRGR